MKPTLKLSACLISVLCTVVASAQLPSTQDGAEASISASPSAYVYVVSSVSNGSELDGYSADSNGALTRLPGSPFWTSKSLYVTGLANTAHWLFVGDGTYIYSFSIASDGSLKKVSTINALQYYFSSGVAGVYLTFDHTGSTLYSLAADGVGDNEFQFFNKNSTTGKLSYFGATAYDIAYGYLSFTGNNLYAYGAACFDDTGFFYGLTRSSNGVLTDLHISPTIPSYSNGNYCSDFAATDPASDLAVAFYLETAQHAPQPPAWLGVYTANSSGSLTTKSTSQNMPTAAVGWLNDMKTSPAGNLLALGGTSGLQVFHFNGSNPITPYTGLLATHELSHLAWDSHDHLYGISQPSGRLYAFRVTTTGYKQASGSPYSIGTPQAITVLSK